MNESSAKETLGMLTSAYPDMTLEPESSAIYLACLGEMDLSLAAPAILTWVKSETRWPRIADLREAYRAEAHRMQQDAERNVRATLPEQTAPEWVARWRRARAAGDYRLFPEQAPGIRELHRYHGSPVGAEAKTDGFPSGYEAEMRLLTTPASDAAVWVQPSEYLDNETPELAKARSA